jgi:hypothetical protein
MSGRRLERWLHYAVHGTPAPRAPRRKARRGPARDRQYLAWIRTLPCAACGTTPAEAAHTGHDGGASQKASDYTCVPLCHECHAEYDNGQESKALFEEAAGIDMAAIVRERNREWFAR